MIVCSCDSTADDFGGYSDFILNLNGTNYSIPPKSYLTSYGKFCTVDVMYMSNLSNWVLGLNFFTNYYVVFDVQN